VARWTTVENSGTVEEWTKRWTFESSLERAALLKVFEDKMSTKWTRAGDVADGSAWSFQDDKGKAWGATLTLTREPVGGWTAVMRIKKA
jgi:hypothetical protein